MFDQLNLILVVRVGEESAPHVAANPPRRKISRRTLLKFSAAAAAVAAAEGATGLFGPGWISALTRLAPPAPRPTPAPWEIAPGVVDYGKVPYNQLAGPTPNVLKVAQWYDYWPGSFLTDFETYMQQTYGMNVTVQVDIYTSNEELLDWITVGGKKYDVMFPTNHVVDSIKKAGLIYNLNLAWIPNYANMWADFIHIPHRVDNADNLDQRLDPSPGGGHMLSTVSAPYFFGTTGIAFRVDKIPKADIEAVGLDFFTMPSYTPSNGWPTVTLKNNMRMLDDQRDVFTFGLKKAGQLWQKAQGIPFSPYTRDYTDTAGIAWKGTQWTSNETDPARVNAMGNWLLEKIRDEFAEADYNPEAEPASALSGKVPQGRR